MNLDASNIETLFEAKYYQEYIYNILLLTDGQYLYMLALHMAPFPQGGTAAWFRFSPDMAPRGTSLSDADMFYQYSGHPEIARSEDNDFRIEPFRSPHYFAYHDGAIYHKHRFG